MTQFTDEQLVIEARQGDKAAFGVLIERYAAMVNRLAMRTIADAELAHDLAQEALLQAYLSLDQLQDPARFRSWLYGITLNVCRSHLRRAKRAPVFFEELAGGIYRDADSPTPEEIAEQVELRSILRRAITRLSPGNREAITLVYYYEYSLQEAARMLGISLNAIKGRLHKSRLQLRVQLDSEWNDRKEIFPMIPVKIVDVRRREILRDSGVSVAMMQVVLFDEAGRRALVIWIGEAEGMPIANKLLNWESPRPMTQTFIARLVEAAGATVQQVQISTLKDDIYYATVVMQTAQGVREVDARPSDALGLAVYAGVPIVASEQVLQDGGRAIPPGATPTGKGLADMLAEGDKRAQIWQAHRAKQQEGKTQTQLTDEISQTVDEVLSEAFGTPA